MAIQTVDQLRAAIDAKYHHAIEALKTVAEYVENKSSIEKHGQPRAPRATKKRSPRAGTGNIRNAVLAVFQEGYSPIREVSEKTGLTIGQVRGVVSAPALKDGFTKKTVDGIMQYHYQDKPEN